LFIEIQRERGAAECPFTEEHLTAMRGGLTAEEYRWSLSSVRFGHSLRPLAVRWGPPYFTSVSLMASGVS
jgi:hypothetical protein